MKRILFIGYRDKKRLLESSLKQKHQFVLLISSKEFKPEFAKLFNQVILVEDLFDWNILKSHLEKEKFDAVMTRYEEYTAIVAAIADHLGLPSSGYQNALKSRNKYLMREAFAKKKVPSADFALVQTLQDCEELVKKHGFPLILKQIAGIHSRYIFTIHSKQELSDQLDFLHKVLADDQGFLNQNLLNYPVKVSMPNPKKFFLLEEMLSGYELTVDTFIVNAEYFFTPICKYITSEEISLKDHHLPIRTMPYVLSSEDQIVILKTVQVALEALGLNFCVTHTEVFYNPQTKTCRLIEVASRGGGFRGEMYAECTGGDYDLALTQTVLGQKPILRNKVQKHINVVEVFAPQDGILKTIDYDFLNQDSSVKYLTLNRQVGQKVGLAKHGGKFILKFLVSDTDPVKSLEKAQIYLQKIQASIQVE